MNNNLTLSLLGVCVALIALLFYRDYSRDREFRQLLLNQQLSGQDGRPAQDPYLANEVKNRIIKGYGDIQLCYKEFLKTKPEVSAGDLKMDWQIDTDGDVISPEVVVSPFRSESFQKCMATKIVAWKFPEPGMKKYVTHTFKFEKSD